MTEISSSCPSLNLGTLSPYFLSISVVTIKLSIIPVADNCHFICGQLRLSPEFEVTTISIAAPLRLQFSSTSFMVSSVVLNPGLRISCLPRLPSFKIDIDPAHFFITSSFETPESDRITAAAPSKGLFHKNPFISILLARYTDSSSNVLTRALKSFSFLAS